MDDKMIDGKKFALYLQEDIEKKVKLLKKKNCYPSLAVIQVGSNKASLTYIRNIQAVCNEVGIAIHVFSFSKDTQQGLIINKIKELNDDEYVHGILLQLPLPPSINQRTVIEQISPKKDVDGLTHSNAGRLFTKETGLIPCTPAAVMALLKHENIEITGKHCVIIGRSNVVGKPLAMLMLEEDASVTICHSKTKNLKHFTQQADILIAALSRKKFIKKDMIKENAVLIDIGIHREDSGQLAGDIDLADCFDKCSRITPVPGGIGAVTVMMLLNQTVIAAEKGLIR